MDKTQRMSAAAYRAAVSGGLCTAESDIKTSYKNRKSSEHGRTFEELIIKGCQFYAANDKAIINKVPEPYMCTRVLNGGNFIGRFTGQAEPDFKGVLKGGRAIAFEAKSTQKDRIRRNVLTPKQMQFLDRQMIMGAGTFVCVNIQDSFFMVPWHTWHDMHIDYGRCYLMAADIPEYEVIFDGAVRFLEYTNGSVIGGGGR